jgi:hypothetical protein
VLFLSTSLWAEPLVLTAVGIMAILLVLLWDWRYGLLALPAMQFILGQTLVAKYGVPLLWSWSLFGVMALSSLILALSVWQVRPGISAYQAGNWLFRTMVLLLAGLTLTYMDIQFLLPRFDLMTTQLILWLAVCAVLTLTLTDGPLFSGIGLLLWMIPAQSIVAVLLPVPGLLAVVGSAVLLVSLACSYLVLAEDTGSEHLALPVTDVTFPVELIPTSRQPQSETQ